MRSLGTIWTILIVVLMLAGCIGKGERMRHDLAMLEEANRNDSTMRNDSLAESLVEYFNDHGTPNERMRAYYILARTYYDIGELPRALETYYHAARSADTTAADCDFKTLSRVHAQAAQVYRRQVQPRSRLNELKKARHYAKIAHDTLIAIECYSEQADAYRTLGEMDSVIHIKECVAQQFLSVNRKDRYAQTLGGILTALIQKGELLRVRQYIDIYESSSGFFDNNGHIKRGREIYYYAKGQYYLAINKLDSAEFLFRKLLKEGSTLNHQIAGNKGLQQVYTQRHIPDSIAKFADLGYTLNDSAYSLSEMENIQKFQASYNYNYNKLFAEQQMRKANRAYLMIAIIVSLVILSTLVSLYYLAEYRKKKNAKISQYRQDLEKLERTQTELMQLRSTEKLEAEILIDAKNRDLEDLQRKIVVQQDMLEARTATVESRLDNSNISRRLRKLLDQNPPQAASQSDFRELRQYAIEVIPSFYPALNRPNCSLRPIEYDVCLLIRFHFQPAEICKLTGRSDSYIANLRKGILLKVYEIKGTPKDLDQKLLQIK